MTFTHSDSRLLAERVGTPERGKQPYYSRHVCGGGLDEAGGVNLKP